MEPCKEVNQLAPGVVAQIEHPADMLFVQDKKGRGFTVYIRGLPNVLAQGKTKSEAVSNLLSSLIDIYSPYLNGDIK